MGNYNLTPDKTGGLGRTYEYFTGTPTYPFGYGLSYTTFGYSGMTADTDASGNVKVSFTVTNTGTTPGATVPQLYVSTPALTQAPQQQLPIERLRGFDRTGVLQPGQSQQLQFTVKLSDLSFWDDQQHRRRVFTGQYRLSLGPDSATASQQRTITVDKEPTPHVQTVTIEPDQVVFTKGQTLDLTSRNPWLADDTDPTTPGRDPAMKADHVVEAAMSDDTFADLSKMHVQYSTSNPCVATIDANGLLTARGAGTATISATVDGVTGTAPIVVSGQDGQACATGGVGGTVPATLSLTLGTPAAFGAFTPGVAKDYIASTTANVISHRRRRDAQRRRSQRDGDRPSGQRLVRAAAGAAGQREQPARRRRGVRPGRRLGKPDDAADLQRPGQQRRGHDRLQAVDRVDGRAADGRLQQDAHVHAVDHDPVT